MAHTCPECGQVCYCRGDCDDIILDGGQAEILCEHCDGDFGGDDYGDDQFIDDARDDDERRKRGEG